MALLVNNPLPSGGGLLTVCLRLTERDEPLHVIPSVRSIEAAPERPGTYVLM